MPADRADGAQIARLGPMVAAAAAQIEHRLFGKALPLAGAVP
jgi:DNA-binding IclR family transcriptional regulator